MADTSLIIGNGNWAVKETSLLGYNIIQSKYVPIEMTVVRATTATRVNSAGLIEVVPINLLTYSEQFDNAGWGKTNTTVTANTTTSPNGTLTADKIIPNTTNGVHNINRFIPVSSSTAHTVSLYAKKGEYSGLRINFISSANTFISVNLNIGVIQSFGGSIYLSSSIESVGNDWYRVTMTFLPPVASSSLNFIVENPIGTVTFAGDNTSGIYLWGAQLETGTTATEYFPTTDRFNIPRVDYSTGTASLLVEPLRTNLVLYSEQFDNVYWLKIDSTITANSATAPDGTLTADKIIEGSTLSEHGVARVGGIASAGTYTLSVFAKAAERTRIAIGNSSASNYAIFDLSTGTVVQGSQGTVTNGAISSIDANGYYRVSCTITVVSLSSISLRLVSTGTTINYLGNGTSGLFVWGAQLESGSNATSYIPTVAASVTRNSDVISKTGVSSLIGQTEGTIYAEINITTFNNGGILAISDGTSANRIQMYKFTDNKIYCERISATQSGSTLIVSSALSVGTYKVAFAYQSGNSYLYINGAQVGATSVATFTFGSMGKVNIGSRFDDSAILNDRIESATLFPTRLTNAQLATLTTI